MEQIRLNKYLARCGICSRRDADKLIEQGRVTVNGRVAQMGQAVTDSDVILVDREPVRGKNEPVVLAFYKPIGVTCSEKDRHAEKLVTELIDYPVRVTYAGRLDKDSEGLLLLTNDGDLIDAMMRGANLHEKEYVVKVDRPVTEEFLTTMSQGIYLEELKQRTRECKVEQLGPYTFKIVLTQGLNRQVRRMCQFCGYRVRQLKRVRVMNIKLGDLRPGEYRKLEGNELTYLYKGALE